MGPSKRMCYLQGGHLGRGFWPGHLSYQRSSGRPNGDMVTMVPGSGQMRGGHYEALLKDGGEERAALLYSGGLGKAGVGLGNLLALGHPHWKKWNGAELLAPITRPLLSADGSERIGVSKGLARCQEGIGSQR